jgi:hypothetical protein
VRTGGQKGGGDLFASRVKITLVSVSNGPELFGVPVVPFGVNKMMVK